MANTDLRRLKYTGLFTTGRPRRRWVDNIKRDLRKIRWDDGMDWIRSGSGYGPVESSCGHDNEPSGFIKCWEVLEWLHS
jgi:hypothetical protein